MHVKAEAVWMQDEERPNEAARVFAIEWTDSAGGKHDSAPDDFAAKHIPGFVPGQDGDFELEGGGTLIVRGGQWWIHKPKVAAPADVLDESSVPFGNRAQRRAMASKKRGPSSGLRGTVTIPRRNGKR